jgi:hypothetical protein
MAEELRTLQYAGMLSECWRRRKLQRRAEG